MLQVINEDIFSYSDGGYVKNKFLKDYEIGDKVGVLVVHFGTTFEDTRIATIDKFNQDIQKAFPNFEFREAYTSRIIMRRLKERGIIKLNPQEVLEQMYKEGFDYVIVQSTHIINGTENDALKKEIEAYNDKFKGIRMGLPLLSMVSDYKEVAQILNTNIGKVEENTGIVWVGHGTHHYAGSCYSMMDYIFEEEGFNNHFVGTIEGYPDFSNVLNRLKKKNIEKVILLPFMFVAGDHAKNDVAIDWYEQLIENGFEVEVRLVGLGESDKIRNIYIKHMEFLLEYEPEDMALKKVKYSLERD